MKKISLARAARWFFIGITALIALIFAQDIFVLHRVYEKARAAPEGYFEASPNADLTVVEFLSYSCEYCKSTHPALMEAIRQDGRIKYIPKPVFMQDEAGMIGAHAAYAAGLQGRFMEMNHALLENQDTINENILLSLALKLGLDGEELIANLENPVIKEVLTDNTIAFIGLEGTGTPAFLIGDRIFFQGMERFPTVEDFLKMFEESRNR